MSMHAHKPQIDTCHACGKLFPRVRVQLCTHCVVVEDNRFAIARDFVLANEGASVGEISAGTGLAAIDVRRFLDSGRLVEVVGAEDEPCTCGGVGERCRSCRMQLSAEFQRMQREIADQERRAGRSGTYVAGVGDEPDDDAPQRVTYVRRMRRIDGR